MSSWKATDGSAISDTKNAGYGIHIDFPNGTWKDPYLDSFGIFCLLNKKTKNIKRTIRQNTKYFLF